MKSPLFNPDPEISARDKNNKKEWRYHIPIKNKY